MGQPPLEQPPASSLQPPGPDLCLPNDERTTLSIAGHRAWLSPIIKDSLLTHRQIIIRMSELQPRLLTA